MLLLLELSLFGVSDLLLLFLLGIDMFTFSGRVGMGKSLVEYSIELTALLPCLLSDFMILGL